MNNLEKPWRNHHGHFYRMETDNLVSGYICRLGRDLSFTRNFLQAINLLDNLLKMTATREFSGWPSLGIRRPLLEFRIRKTSCWKHEAYDWQTNIHQLAENHNPSSCGWEQIIWLEMWRFTNPFVEALHFFVFSFTAISYSINVIIISRREIIWTI